MNVRKKNLGSAFKRVLTGVLCLALVLSMVPAVLATEAESGLFDLSGSSMTLGNTLEINFAIDTAYLEADGNYAVISKEYADARGTVTKTVPQSQWKPHSGTVEYFSYAVSAKEMNDKLTVTVYNAGGEQLSNPYEDSVAGYCLRMLGKEEEKAAPNKQIMSLLVDMLNYGAAAQAEWSYNTDALANAGLSETQKGYATVPGEANSCLEKGTGYYGTSLSLKENLLMNFAYYADQIQDAAYAEVTFIDHYGNDESETIQAKDFKTYDAQVKYIEITSMAVADCRKSVTVTLYDAEGNALSTTVDSAESYISRMSGDIYDAILAFSDGAHNYFHSEDADPGQGENTTVISGNVSTEDGKVAEDAAFADGDVSAQVPAGVQVDGDTLTLTITEKNTSDSGVELEEGQQILPLDIHIDGVSEENATPIQVCLGKILPNGLNIGNVTLYHVEDGAANEMTQVMTLAELDEHNEFYYDPATGDITVAMASFSEVAMVSTESEWTGGVDHTWYKADATELTIANADQLWSFSQIVGGMAEGIEQDSFAGKTIKLIADINLADDEDNNDSNKIFYPIGYNSDDSKYEKTGVAVSTGFYTFKGTFDGQGHTISNFYQNTWEMKGDNNYYDATLQYYRDGMGLFGKIYCGTVKNLTVKNFSSDGEFTTTGTIAAYAEGATFENIAIFNCNPRVYNIGNGGIVGCVGWYAKEANLKTTFTNITVDNSNKISALWGSWDVACGGLVGQYYPTSGQSSADYPVNGGIHMDNCHVAAQIDVYNDVCANYQYYAYRYAGMLIGSIRENVTGDDGHVYPKMDGITASGCTVHFGDWNDYYYCELVANSLASYTHDHQMSRLEQVEAVDVENMTVTPLEGEATAIPTSGRYNYVVVKAKDADGMWIHGDGANYATCYHFVDGAVWNHADAGTETVDGVEGVLKEDKQLIYREFNQLFTGYGWGVTSKGLTDYEGVENMDITHSDKEESVVKFASLFTEDFLYRVGNANTVSLGSLFKAVDGATINNSGVYVTIDEVEEDTSVFGTFTASTTDNWEDGTITFTGTGPVKLTIQDYDYCKPTVLYLEVVDAYNVTAYSGGSYPLSNRNSVLLNDITMSSGSSFYLSNATLYGNGFTFDVTDGDYSAPGIDGDSYVIKLVDSNLNNIKIIGAVYTEFGGTRNDDYNRAIVFTTGDSTIANSYISNGASPVRNGGNLEIISSTLKGGIYANLDHRNGHLILDNVTTINQVENNDKHIDSSGNETVIVGLGVVVYQEGGSETMSITIKNALTQYNYLSQAQADTYITDTMANMVTDTMFSSDFSQFQYNDGTTTWVNAGIISMNNYFSAEDLYDERSSHDYIGQAKTISQLGVSRDCYVYTATPTQIDTAPSYTSAGQYMIAPTVTPDFTNKNYIAKTEGSNDYCYEDNGTVFISMDQGDVFNWDSSILTITKAGMSLDYTVTMDDVDYTGKSIVFDTDGTYHVKYTYTDPLNYRLNNGSISTYSHPYTKTIVISVVAVKPNAKHAEFTFGAIDTTGGTTYAGKTVQIGNDTYVMPDVSATVSGKIGSTTVGGTTVYYPITEMYTSDGANERYSYSSWYACFPIFKNALRIVDYADGGVSDTALVYDHSTVTTTSTIPATLAATNPTSDFLYQMNADSYPPPTTAYAVSSTVCYTCNQSGLTGGNTRNEMTIVAQYKYTDNAGTTYYYYVGYHCAAQTTKSICVTGDTLVTLADGSQKRVDEVTYSDQLKVWNFFTGDYDSAPAAILFYHGDDLYEVLKLTFSDGTSVKVVNNHGFFDVASNNWVFIDKDNAASYIGHDFVKTDADGYCTVKLVDYAVIEEYTGSYSIQTAQHNNFVVENLFSITMPEYEGWFDYFEIGDGMKYDEEKMNADIEKYGLYTYEDFADYVTYEQFIAFNGPYLKVLVGRGVVTYEQILELIETYVNPL